MGKSIFSPEVMVLTKATSVFLKILLFSLILTASILLLSLFFDKWAFKDSSSSLPAQGKSDERPTVILDAGHGGIDSGAVSVNGDEEKHINLSLVKKLGAFLEEGGVRVIYTRHDDSLLTSEGAVSRKSGDLMARAALAKENPDAIFVSIHMNTLPIEKYKGLQVFYSDNASASRALAQLIQNDVSALMQSDNKREAKDAAGKIYLLDRITTPAVLIECGFLSNREEAALLIQEDYQTKLAYTLSRTLLNFTRQRNNLE